MSPNGAEILIRMRVQLLFNKILFKLFITNS